MTGATAPAAMDKLLQVMRILRDPETGCPWDVVQTSASIAPYTIEEAYEVVDAIERGDPEELRDELGDLLLQVVFHARIAEESGAFAFDDVAAAIVAKLVRRHPHVFDADGTVLPARNRSRDPDDVQAAWARIKAEERAERAARDADRNGSQPAPAPLDGIPSALPALARAERISRRAAGYGFDWPSVRDVIAKVREETDEVEESLGASDPDAVAEEIGDLLFCVANLARHAGVDPEEALRRGTRKFERRFAAMAARLERDGRSLADSDLAAMEEGWQAVKRDEAASKPPPSR